MMEAGNKAHELADLRAEQERDAGIAAASAALVGDGSDICVRCGEEIEPERLAALPSARRCVDCQSKLEREQSRGRR